MDQMEGRLRNQVDADDLERMTNYRAGHAALRVRDYAGAWTHFVAAFQHQPFEGQDGTILVLLRALQKIGPDDPRAATIRAALSRLAAGA